MFDVKVFIHDGSTYLYPHWIARENAEEYLNEWKQILFPLAKKENKDHFVFCTKEYVKGVLKEINIYFTGLDDDVFHKRMDNLHRVTARKGAEVWIGAWHKGTAY